MLQRVDELLEGLLRYPDELPPNDITVDALAVFPFGTAGDKLDSNSLAICRKALELAIRFKPPIIYTMGGWRAESGLPTEGRLYTERLTQLFDERQLHFTIESDERTATPQEYAQFLCDRIPPRRGTEEPYRLLLVAQTFQLKLVRMLVRRCVPPNTLIFVASAGSTRWQNNANWLYQNKTRYLLYELAVFWSTNLWTFDRKLARERETQQR